MTDYITAYSDRDAQALQPSSATNNIYTSLPNYVQKVFGKRIKTANECGELATDIFRKTGFKINENTLRRLFGLVKCDYLPSRETAKLLATYCGFKSSVELQSHIETMLKLPENNEDEILLNYLTDLFKDASFKATLDKTAGFILKNAINELNLNCRMAEYLQLKIVKNKNERHFYFQTLANINMINSFYGQGLRHYISESVSNEDKMFGYAMLCLRDWLVNDAVSLEENHNHIIKSRFNNMPVTHAAVWYTARLLYAASAGHGLLQIQIDAHEYYRNINSAEHHALLSFEFILAQAFVLSGNYADAFYYLNNVIVKYKSVNVQEAAFSVLQETLLLKAIAHFKIDEHSKAQKCLCMVEPNLFNILSDKMYNILYILSLSNINNDSKSAKQEFALLVKQTGFVRLPNFFVKLAA